jgi:transposase
MDNVTTRSVGIDVAKAPLAIAVRPDRAQWRAAHDEAGISDLVTRRHAVPPPLVVLEATGGRAAAVVAALAASGIPVAVVTPRPVRDCARASGHLATTDALDAQVRARVAEGVHPQPRPLPDAQAQECAALLARRRQLVGLLTAERQRLDTATPVVGAHIARQIGWLEHELAELDRSRHEQVQASPLWRAPEDLLRRVPGIGPTTAFTRLAEWPALGHRDRQAIAALVGVAPLSCERGTWRGTRIVWGGRARVRTALDMPALVASRHHPVIRAVYQRLCAAGQPQQLALVACMHQLLTLLNAMLRHRSSWQAATAPTT